jgi:hypothetical protein
MARESFAQEEFYRELGIFVGMSGEVTRAVDFLGLVTIKFQGANNWCYDLDFSATAFFDPQELAQSTSS